MCLFVDCIFNFFLFVYLKCVSLVVNFFLVFILIFYFYLLFWLFIYLVVHVCLVSCLYVFYCLFVCMFFVCLFAEMTLGRAASTSGRNLSETVRMGHYLEKPRG